MYNEEIKRKFIEDYAESKSREVSVVKIFNFSNAIEEQNQTDIYFIDYNVIAQLLLKNLRVLSYSSFFDYISILKHYKQWCMLNGYFSESNYFPIYNVSDLELKQIYNEYMSENIFRSIIELHKHIDDILEIDTSKEFLQKNELLKLYPLLLYCGIHENDIVSLKPDNIKIMNNGVFIEYRNKIVNITDKETQQLLVKRKKCNTYEIDRGRWTEFLDLPDLLITFGSEDTEYNKRQIASEISKAYKVFNNNNKANRKNQPFNIYVCGVMSKIKQDEEVNGYKIKIKDLYKWFEENGYPEDIATRGKKKIIKETYKVW